MQTQIAFDHLFEAHLTADTSFQLVLIVSWIAQVLHKSAESSHSNRCPLELVRSMFVGRKFGLQPLEILVDLIGHTGPKNNQV